MPKLKLFCIPHAGAMASMYRRWSQYLNCTDIEFIPIELAGRGARIGEPFYEGVEAAAQDVADTMDRALADFSGSYALWGHSMGSLIAFEAARRMNEMHGTPPIRLFVSGRKAPNLEHSRRKVYDLPEEEFVQAVMEYDGTPSEVFQHEELARLMIPILRADFRIVETYRFDSERGPVNCPIVVMYGHEDMTPKEASAWSSVTTGACTVHRFEGGHFFIHQQPQAVAERIRQSALNDSL